MRTFQDYQLRYGSVDKVHVCNSFLFLSSELDTTLKIKVRDIGFVEKWEFVRWNSVIYVECWANS
jgi:hypothetical protein